MNNKPSTRQLRQTFLDFFKARGHTVVPSSSLVPANDPTLLFTNAGMVQFKDVFLGAEKRDYSRAVTAQRCVRAGGKHNDLDQVGYTARHHTFFEMLGNFSFGDYFKREAIQFAWQLLTEELGLPPEKLWVTVYEEDDEAADIWLKEIGVDPARFTRIGDKPGKRYESDNFWAMGDTGPCGPCSEIFYDHGPEVAGGPPGTPEEDGDRYVEIWNLVFMQYDRDAEGHLKPLPRPCVDTGMGLERLAAVIQGVHSNYDIDLFQALIARAAKLTGCGDLQHPSLKVIADHIRACAFLIVDGVLPSNEGRGYVLRRIIRRAARHGYLLGQAQPFFYRMLPALVEQMGEAYPELASKEASVAEALEREERRFAETLEKGMKILEEKLERIDDKTIPGDVVFLLYDTYGFPVDLTADIAREKGLRLDMEGFEQAMNDQRERARSASQFDGADHIDAQVLTDLPATVFTGYEHCQEAACQVLALVHQGQAVDCLEPGQQGLVILDRTPFYAESGGQVGDTGILEHAGAHARVLDTRKLGGVFHGHQVEVVSGRLCKGETVEAHVDETRRQRIRLNHSATHLLHAALRTVLGEHVQQKGSLVDADKLRFDFSHPEPVSREQLLEIERLVNDKIRENPPAETAVLPYDEAIAAGAMALFGEKYGDKVRVLKLGDFSVELCGGTHVDRTGDIGLFRIVSETGIAAGIRRIEALTGPKAVEWVEAQEALLQQASQLLKAPSEEIPDKLQQLFQKQKALEKELEQLQRKLAAQAGDRLSSQAEECNGVRYLLAEFSGDAKTLRETAEKLRDQLQPAAVALASVDGDKVRLVATVSKALTDRLKAGEWVNAMAVEVGGKGGGRPDMAQAGGSDPERLDQALQAGKALIQARICG